VPTAVIGVDDHHRSGSCSLARIIDGEIWVGIETAQRTVPNRPQL